MTDKEAMQSRFADDNPLQGKRVPQFEQRAIPLSGKLSHNRSRMGLNLMGSTVTTQRAGPNIALTLMKLTSSAHARRAYSKTAGRLPVRSSLRNRAKDTFTKINRQGFRHLCRPPIGRKLESELHRFEKTN